MNKEHIGSNFDDWLKEIGEGYLINISACKHFKGLGECEIMEGLCIKNECYYKENERLKAENEELKAFKRECLKPVYLPDIEPEVINKYKQALEDVREITKKYYLSDKKLLATGIEINPYGAIIEIQDKINEVLKSENH